jgi:hypothetical protein
MSIYTILREGLKSKSKKVSPQIEEVKIPKPEDVKPLLERKYTKHFNNGNTQVWDTIIVVGEIKDWNRAHRIDEVIEVQEKHINTTAIIEKGEDDSKKEVIKYLPIPIDGSKKPVYVSLGGSAWMDTKQVHYDFGIGIDTKKNNFSLFKDPTTGFDNLEGYRLQYQRKLIRVSKND